MTPEKLTPEKLVALCDAAEGDHLVGRPCPECDARDELYEDFGFSLPARARRYAALEIDNAKLREALEDEGHDEFCPGSDPPYRRDECLGCKALATGGTK